MLAASTLLEAVQAPPEFWTKVRFAQLDMEQNRADRSFQHSTCSLVLFFVSSSQEATAEGREKPERRGTHLISMILSSPLLLEQDAPIVETWWMVRSRLYQSIKQAYQRNDSELHIITSTLVYRSQLDEICVSPRIPNSPNLN